MIFTMIIVTVTRRGIRKGESDHRIIYELAEDEAVPGETQLGAVFVCLL